MLYKLNEYNKEVTLAKVTVIKKGREYKEVKSYLQIRVRGLDAYDQTVIDKYIEILWLLKEAISLFKGWGKTGAYSTI